MKAVKIKIIGFEDKGIEYFFDGIDLNKYNIEYSDNPDYVFFTGSHNYREAIKYNCIRINYDIESLHTDFNIADYTLTQDRICFGDSVYQYKYWYMDINLIKDEERRLLAERINKMYTLEDVASKRDFCNFICSNGGAKAKRNEIFEKVSEYKFVHSAGRFRNNMNGWTVPGGIGEYIPKIEFQSHFKFSLALDNIDLVGSLQEKVLHAFMAGTIPIYWGDPDVGRIFNTEAMINVGDFDNYEKLIDRIKELDTDDNKYLEVLNKPIFNPNYKPDEEKKKIGAFIENIFDQEYESAFRRPNLMNAEVHRYAMELGYNSLYRRRKIGRALDKYMHLGRLKNYISRKYIYRKDK